MAGINTTAETNASTSQNLSSVTSPDDMKDSVHQVIWEHLPIFLKQATEHFGTGFDDCRIEYYRDYRILFITPEGLGLDMDHRQNDVNYFQADALDIAYSEDDVEYIGRRKAKQYESYSQVSLFRAIWTDVVEELGGLKPGPGILQP